MSRTREFAATSTIFLAGFAALPAVSLLALLGASDDGPLTSGEKIWIGAAMTLAVVLLAGLVLRLREERPRLATALLAVGAPAPALAWFWFPPLYLLSAAVFVLALVTHPRPGPAVAT